MSEYERKRTLQIQENTEKLKALGFKMCLLIRTPHMRSKTHKVSVKIQKPQFISGMPVQYKRRKPPEPTQNRV